MRKTGKAALAAALTVLCWGTASSTVLAQGTTIEFRVVPTGRHPAGCNRWDAELSRVHTFVTTNDGATLRTAGGITRNMIRSAPNVYTTTFAIGGTNFNVTADASTSPKTLEVSEPRVGCLWHAIVP